MKPDELQNKRHILTMVNINDVEIYIITIVQEWKDILVKADVDPVYSAYVRLGTYSIDNCRTFYWQPIKIMFVNRRDVWNENATIKLYKRNNVVVDINDLSLRPECIYCYDLRKKKGEFYDIES